MRDCCSCSNAPQIRSSSEANPAAPPLPRNQTQVQAKDKMQTPPNSRPKVLRTQSTGRESDANRRGTEPGNPTQFVRGYPRMSSRSGDGWLTEEKPLTEPK